jgi:hypothetical protein
MLYQQEKIVGIPEKNRIVFIDARTLKRFLKMLLLYWDAKF